MMIQQTLIVSRANSKKYKTNKVKKLALNSQLPNVQILTNDVQVLILCIYYLIITVSDNHLRMNVTEFYFLKKRL